MLEEFKEVRQIKGEPKRRWFFDDFFDLVVWYDQRESICGFQLCYDIGRNEKAITWMKNGSYTHDNIDDGNINKFYKMTPVLVPNGNFRRDLIILKFESACKNIEPEIKDQILIVLEQYSDNKVEC